MPGLPVAINKNLNNATNQLPIAGDTGIPGALGGIKADGTSIVVDQTTGVASAAGGPGAISGTLTPGVLPVATAAHVLGDSHLDDGKTTALTITAKEPVSIQAHAAMGLGATVDGTPNFFTNPVESILNLIETLTTPDGENGIYAEIDWNPSTDIPSGGYTPFGLGTQFICDLDGQATDDSTPCGIVSFCTSNGDVTPLGDLIGALIGVTNQGNADATNVVAVDAFTTSGGSGHCTTTGVSVAGETHGTGAYIGFTEGLMAVGGHLTDAVGYLAEPPGLTGGAIIDRVFGMQIEDMTQGTQNWAIRTGLGLVEFGDNLKVDKIIQAGTIYSAAGTALPAAATEGVGARAFVSDATVNVFHSAYVSGGANKVPVFSDGANWLIG